MKRSSFRLRLVIVSATAILVVVVCAIAKIEGWEKIYGFFKDMSAYLLLAIGPYVGYLFQRRAKFLDLLQDEWRRVTAVKQDIVSYCVKGQDNIDEYVRVFGGLSTAIDNMRVVYRNVGESKTHLGYFPYETLHDFRRQLKSIDPRIGQIDERARRDVARQVIEGFKGFRDTFLIELESSEPDYPIVQSGVVRRRLRGVDPNVGEGPRENWRIIIVRRLRRLRGRRIIN